MANEYSPMMPMTTNPFTVHSSFKDMTAVEKRDLARQILVKSGFLTQYPGQSITQADIEEARKIPGADQALAAGGYPVSTFPWLTVLGLGAGAVAAYFVWKNYTKTKSLGKVVYPDPDENRIQMRGLSKSLSHFKGRSNCKPSRRMGRLGAAPEKYEFEPESRLEGLRRRKRSFKRSIR